MSERTYYAKVAVVGPSGSGKSYLCKTADKETTGYINVERKPLPFSSGPFKFEGKPKNWAAFKKNLEDYGKNPDIKQIIIDTQSKAFSILNKEMANNFSGYDVYKNYNKQVYEYLEILLNIEKDVIVLSHEEILPVEGEKVKRMVVQGKEFEGKIEREFTIVLYTNTRLKNGRPEYFLNTFQLGTSSKTPEGMFPDNENKTLLEIPNDANYIFSEMERFYSTREQ